MTPSILPSFVNTVAPQAAPQPNAQASSQPGFAQMLSQRQAAAPAPAPAPAPKAPAAEKPKTPEKVAEKSTSPQSTERQVAARSDRALKNEPAKAVKTQPGSADAKASHAEAKADAKTDATDTDTDTDSTIDTASKPDDAIDPALADFMAALKLPAPPAPEEAAVPAGGAGALLQGALKPEVLADAPAELTGTKEGTVETGGAQKSARRVVADQEPADRLHAASEGREAKDARATDALAGADSTASWQAVAEQARHTVVEATARHETPAVGALGAAGAVTSGSAVRAGDAAASATATVNVPTPATSPEFANALGVHVSVLARDGIQKAELHLNPAEMGPISVQIALDGTQAQVNFGVDSAATRQIIENGLPELAASLRDAGFTLSGGGVHQQAQGQAGREGGNGSGNATGGRGASAGEEDVTPRRINTRVSAGGVDLYA